MEAVIAAFHNSMRGFAYAIRSERAIRQEFLVLGATVPAAFIISQHLWVRVGLISVILITLAIELLNTAIEKVCDYISPNHHPLIGMIKDMGSASVFCMLVVTAVVWGAAILEYAGL